MSCIDTPRDILEGWIRMAGLEVIPGETKAELSIRLRSSFYFWIASGEVEDPKPQILDITRDFIKERL